MVIFFLNNFQAFFVRQFKIKVPCCSVCERGSHDTKNLADRCPELKDSGIILGTYSREFPKRLCLDSGRKRETVT